ncbi:MAG: hypothetical protein ABIS50_14600 [Luteolibacter sp.]|uniref:hypothetical protein n=1 Tax=Luteolibacter sp. TaxID=1962973 RepID=UPI003267DAEB
MKFGLAAAVVLQGNQLSQPRFFSKPNSTGVLRTIRSPGTTICFATFAITKDMKKNLSSQPIFKYPVSGVGQNFIYSCHRLASILQLTEEELLTGYCGVKPNKNGAKRFSATVIQSGIEMKAPAKISESRSA